MDVEAEIRISGPNNSHRTDCLEQFNTQRILWSPFGLHKKFEPRRMDTFPHTPKLIVHLLSTRELQGNTIKVSHEKRKMIIIIFYNTEWVSLIKSSRKGDRLVWHISKVEDYCLSLSPSSLKSHTHKYIPLFTTNSAKRTTKWLCLDPKLLTSQDGVKIQVNFQMSQAIFQVFLSTEICPAECRPNDSTLNLMSQTMMVWFP